MLNVNLLLQSVVQYSLPGVLQGLLARFASQAGLWQKAVKRMAELDALMALGYAAQFGGEGAPMCRPTFVDPQPSSTGQPDGHVSNLLVL